MTFQLITHVYAVLALVADGAVIISLVGFLITRLSTTGKTWWGGVRDFISPWALHLAWVVAMLATLGSLYLSQIAGLVPCEFCWFQRIAMYPLSLLLGIAAFRHDWLTAKKYLFWLPLVGAGLAA